VAALKVFVVDYASCCDERAGAPSASVRHQEQMTLRALLADLDALPGVELVGAGQQGPFRHRFDAGVRAADAVWLLVPGEGGLLERLSRAVLRSGALLLGSRPGALRVSTSQRRTSHALAQARIDVAPAYTPGQRLPAHSGAWVVKPDDGAGWRDTHLFPGATAALAWIGAAGAAATPAARYVLLPFIPGKLGNLSLLCCNGSAQLLGCNEQRIAMRNHQFHLLGSTVNRWPDTAGAFERLAQAVSAAIPGLWGHVGVDFVMAERGLVVLEVSARLGHCYAGLHASLGCNPAALALDLLAQPQGPPRPRQKPRPVSIDVAPFDHV
jgi:predicted ATP-grasp superfamily ATP-dependent carboligase